MNAIRDIVQRVFGPLTPNTHTYYSKVAGEVWWTEYWPSPECGQACRLAINICGPDPDDPDDDTPPHFLVDFWWVPSWDTSSMQGIDIPPLEPDDGRVYTTEEEARRILEYAQTELEAEVDAIASSAFECGA